MSKRPRARRETPQPAPDDKAAARRRAIASGMYWLAAICLMGLALVEIADVATTALRWVFMAGIAVAGTAIIVLQAQRTCPHCGASYGYYPRLFKPNICRRCGGEFPRWSPDERL